VLRKFCEKLKIWAYAFSPDIVGDRPGALMMPKTAPEATIEAARLEEIRFAKRQQWAVAIATITFIAGAFHIAHTVQHRLACWEKVVATILVVGVLSGGCWLLFRLQDHLCRTRLLIDWRDKNPWWRGTDVLFGLVIALIISAGAVCYSFWRYEAYGLLLRMQGQVF
jgi:hypothetical protein